MCVKVFLPIINDFWVELMALPHASDATRYSDAVKTTHNSLILVTFISYTVQNKLPLEVALVGLPHSKQVATEPV